MKAQQRKDLAKLMAHMYGKVLECYGETTWKALFEGLHIDYNDVLKALQKDGYDTTWLKTLDTSGSGCPDGISFNITGLRMDVDGVGSIKGSKKSKEVETEEEETIDITQFMS